MECRKHHGAVFFAAAIFPAEAFRLSGYPKAYRDRYFCGTCGSAVFARSGDEVDVHLGALDAPGQFEPSYELWCSRREPWLPEFPTMTQFAQNRVE